MKKFSRREKGVLIATLLAGLTFALDRYALAPIWKAWRQMDMEIARKEKEIREDHEILRDRKEIERDYLAFAHSARKETLPDATALLGEIESLARKSGVKIIDIKPEPSHRDSSRDVSVSIITESTWEPLARFIYQIHRSPRSLRLEKAGLNRKSEDAATLQGQLLIVT
jgi:hypothetical protein